MYSPLIRVPVSLMIISSLILGKCGMMVLTMVHESDPYIMLFRSTC